MDYFLQAAKDPALLALAQEAEARIGQEYAQIENIKAANQMKVLAAFRRLRVAPSHFAPSYGYGYDDPGREKLEALFAEVFGAQDALVRPGLASGTHALACALFGMLGKGDELLFATGTPYDTLHSVIGSESEPYTLKGMGITYKEIPIKDGNTDLAALAEALKSAPRVVMLQRSRGYATRNSLTIADIEKIAELVKRQSPQSILFVDNCYGEFTDAKEPCEVGADIMAGSLIKNPGGGLAPTGGYIAGRPDLIERISYRMTSPGIGREVGSYAAGYLPYFQGLYLAPHVVAESLKGAVFTASVLDLAGFAPSPRYNEKRGCIIQAVNMENENQLCAFCRAVQAWSPVDSFARPEPAPMPGYEDPVIMAAGAFIQGSSIELSADAPLRPPYTLFIQGGLVCEQVKAAVLAALHECGHS